MPLHPVQLPFRGLHATIWLRDLCGADEDVVEGVHSAAAIALLDRLMSHQAGAALGPGDAALLTTADRDQVLAALCVETFGDRVDGTRTCERCGERFDLTFRISDLSRALVEGVPPPPADGVYRVGEAVAFRLPTGADELASAGLPAEAAEEVLLDRCLVSGDRARDRERVLAEMGRVGPTLDLDLDAVCSECAAGTQVAFSMQAWFLGQLHRGGQALPRQIHLLARAYGWSRDDILSLPRHQRLALVDLVEEERRASSRSLSP